MIKGPNLPRLLHQSRLALVEGVDFFNRTIENNPNVGWLQKDLPGYIDTNLQLLKRLGVGADGLKEGHPMHFLAREHALPIEPPDGESGKMLLIDLIEEAWHAIILGSNIRKHRQIDWRSPCFFNPRVEEGKIDDDPMSRFEHLSNYLSKRVFHIFNAIAWFYINPTEERIQPLTQSLIEHFTPLREQFALAGYFCGALEGKTSLREGYTRLAMLMDKGHPWRQSLEDDLSMQYLPAVGLKHDIVSILDSTKDSKIIFPDFYFREPSKEELIAYGKMLLTFTNNNMSTKASERIFKDDGDMRLFTSYISSLYNNRTHPSFLIWNRQNGNVFERAPIHFSTLQMKDFDEFAQLARKTPTILDEYEMYRDHNVQTESGTSNITYTFDMLKEGMSPEHNVHYSINERHEVLNLVRRAFVFDGMLRILKVYDDPSKDRLLFRARNESELFFKFGECIYERNRHLTQSFLERHSIQIFEESFGREEEIGFAKRSESFRDIYEFSGTTIGQGFEGVAYDVRRRSDGARFVLKRFQNNENLSSYNVRDKPNFYLHDQLLTMGRYDRFLRSLPDDFPKIRLNIPVAIGHDFIISPYVEPQPITPYDKRLRELIFSVNHYQTDDANLLKEMLLEGVAVLLLRYEVDGTCRPVNLFPDGEGFVIIDVL
ncbi:MAG: hypothetical protein ABIE74_12930 [Pseudomonadota bacterium]